MFGISRFWYGVAAILCVFLLYAKRPYATALPVTDEDLLHLEDDLSRLSDQDAALVRAFLKRMGGKVDPIVVNNLDRPNNAHTFGEAIEAQKIYEDQQREEAKRLKIENEKLEAELAPLKAHLQVEFIKAEQIKGDAALARAGFQQGSDVLVTRYRVRNVRGTPIERASIYIQQSLPTESYRLGLNCRLELPETLRPFSRQELVCYHRAHSASPELVETLVSGGTSVLTWRPDSIEFADGRTLKAPSRL